MVLAGYAGGEVGCLEYTFLVAIQGSQDEYETELPRSPAQLHYQIELCGEF